MAHRGCGAVLLAAALVLPLADAKHTPGAAPEAPDRTGACQRIRLVDAGTDEPVAGAEDFVVDRASGRIFLAAYDRWALDDAVAAGAEKLPQGAIYAAPLRSLTRKPEVLPLRRLAEGEGRDFHPHGLAIDRSDGTARLFAINHEYRRSGGSWMRTSAIESYRIAPGGLTHLATRRHDRLCRANNLAALGPRDLLVTRDHGTCHGVGRWLEDILGLDRAEVIRASLDAGGGLGLETVADGLAFANGIAVAPQGNAVAVAATREPAVRIYDGAKLVAGEPDALRRTVPVAGGPDNLTWTAAGGLVAAVHPSLFDAGLARHRWLGARRAGSKAVAVNPESGLTRTLLHDPTGERLNTGTTAAVVNGTLIVSAVLDHALLVCRK